MVPSLFSSMLQFLEADLEKNLSEHRDPATPKEVIALVRLFDDLRAPKAIFGPAVPPLAHYS
jgi:hypothetical protein